MAKKHEAKKYADKVYKAVTSDKERIDEALRAMLVQTLTGIAKHDFTIPVGDFVQAAPLADDLLDAATSRDDAVEEAMAGLLAGIDSSERERFSDEMYLLDKRLEAFVVQTARKKILEIVRFLKSQEF